MRGLVHGPRAITCMDPACSGSQMVDIADADVDDIDFVMAP
jgi:hypothetical protein